MVGSPVGRVEEELVSGGLCLGQRVAGRIRLEKEPCKVP